jgi:hypothetical protein
MRTQAPSVDKSKIATARDIVYLMTGKSTFKMESTATMHTNYYIRQSIDACGSYSTKHSTEH